MAETQHCPPAIPYSSVGTEARMDGSQFDTLARAIAQSGSRRRLLARLIASLPVVGVLAVVGAGESAAERPIDRVQGRTPQRNRKQRNTRNNNNQNNKKNNRNNRNTNDGGGARLGAGDACLTPADCASGACCQGTCCQPPATQCNLAGLCCAPNCAGRQCGLDGCGGTGTCGSCPPCQTCSDSGQCQPVPNGTPCSDGNPLCLNGRCCTAGHEVVHGGCFQITSGVGVCPGCNTDNCGCGRGIDGSPNFLCAAPAGHSCQRTTDCPVGQACQVELAFCLKPC
jgi:hypothetical protein